MKKLEWTRGKGPREYAYATVGAFDLFVCKSRTGGQYGYVEFENCRIDDLPTDNATKAALLAKFREALRVTLAELDELESAQ
jgi:hypothetical protein